MKKIAIIGGGIAGLSAGCYARMNGYDAHIFEMHDLPGGLCTSWKRKGYTFDGSVHWLQGTSPDHPYHEIWRQLGALNGKKIFNKDISLKVALKDRTISFSNDPDRLAEYLRGIAPEDAGMIEELAGAVRPFYPMLDMPLTKPKELYNVFDKLGELKSMWHMIKLFGKYGKMTGEKFAGRFKNPVLREAILSISQSDSIDSDSMNGIVGALFSLATKGYGFPEGGSLELARSIERRYAGLGGQIHYGARVKKILVEGGKAAGVLLENGATATADVVISAADGCSTIFTMLDGRFVNKKIKRCYEKEPVAPSFVQVSIGVDMDVSKAFDPNAIFTIFQPSRPVMIAGKANKIMRVKNYSFDPTFAPKGKSALVLPFASGSEYWEKIHSDAEKYNDEKKRIGAAVVAGLEEMAPGIGEKIEVVDVATPMTYIRYTGTWKGSSMGFAKAGMLDLPRILPGLDGFYMAGQWVGDMGVSGAAKSGRDILELVCGKDGKRFTVSEA